MNSRLGIIGGGQLALYLCEAAQSLGAEVAVLADPGDAPALERANQAFVNSPDSTEAVADFMASCDVVTFDKEAISDDLLTQLVDAEQSGHFLVRPGVKILRLLKDKAAQKAWLVRNELPTLPYVVLPAASNSPTFLESRFGPNIVQKARTGGYDGRGVQILAPLSSAQQLWNVPSIIEPYLHNSTEIAVIVARAPCGSVQVFPPVSMEFDSQLNSVKTVVMPAVISGALLASAEALACTVVEKLEGIGVFAIEMFVTTDGQLLINEISPRVHNAGHITLDACNVSQFEQHVRAVLGMPLVPVAFVAPGVMVNILEDEDGVQTYPVTPNKENVPDVTANIYWYGKTPGRPGRKMGHINAVGPDIDNALYNAREVMAKLSNISEGEAV